jgi:hypothetical protein
MRNEAEVPKEKIYDSATLFDVEVGWNAEAEYVQVGIGTHDGRSIAEFLAGQEEQATPEDSPQVQRSRVGMPNPDATAPPSFTSLWATLDRRQINRLIWALRRARDAAYGRDE